MTSTTIEVNEHLLELIRDNWGLSARNVTAKSGLPRRMVMAHLREMEGNRTITNRDGQYVANR